MKEFRKNPSDFTRNRKLPLTHLLGQILTQVAHAHAYGMEISSQLYFAQWNLCSAENDQLKSPSRSSICEARSKLSWKAFEHLLSEAELCGENASHWKGHRVRAVDGTKLQIPHSEEIERSFPRRINNGSLEHYPLGALMVAMDIFTGQPTSATFTNKCASERNQLLELSEKFFRTGDLCLLDRGFEGKRVWSTLEQRGQFFVNRIRALKGSWKSFPPDQVRVYWTKNPVTGERKHQSFRLIRAQELSDGLPLLIATNLMDPVQYPAEEIIALYKKRWKVETLYYHIKSCLALTRVRAKTSEGIRQEVWAHLLWLSIAALAIQAAEQKDPKALAHSKNPTRPNFKNALALLAVYLPWVLTGFRAQDGSKRLEQLLELIRQTRCPIQSGRSYPRVSKRSQNSWICHQKNRLLKVNVPITPEAPHA